MKIDAQVFDCTWAVKTELENILTRVCYHPPTMTSLTNIENSILDVVRQMCAFDSISVDIVVNTLKPQLPGTNTLPPLPAPAPSSINSGGYYSSQ